METKSVIKYSLRKDDQVAVIAGKEKGHRGKVLKVDTKSGRVFVEKLNMVMRHTKASQQQSAGIIEQEGSIHYSNVLLVCPKCDRGVRHGQKLMPKEKGRSSKVRVCKSCGETLDLARA